MTPFRPPVTPFGPFTFEGQTVEIPDLEISRAGFVYRGGRLYNSLSRNLRMERSISIFKKGAKG
jgi:hypothetical protein